MRNEIIAHVDDGISLSSTSCINFWQDDIDQSQEERLNQLYEGKEIPRKATRYWWHHKGVNGIEIIEYRAHLALLHHWCSKYKYIPPVRDHQIFPFLNICNYDCYKTFKLILKHYELRKIILETFEMRDPYAVDIQEVWSYLKFGVLPKVNHKGYLMIFIGLWNFCPYIFDWYAVLRLFNMGIETINMCYGVHSSFEFIIHARGFSPYHIPWKLRVLLIYFVKYIQYGFPINVKAIHIIDAEQETIEAFQSILFLLDKKLFKKVYFHSYKDNLNSFYRIINKQFLPKDIGGFCGNVLEYQKKLQDHIESLWGWFETEEIEWTTLAYHIESESSIDLSTRTIYEDQEFTREAIRETNEIFQAKLKNIYDKFEQVSVTSLIPTQNITNGDGKQNEISKTSLLRIIDIMKKRLKHTEIKRFDLCSYCDENQRRPSNNIYLEII